MDLSTILSLSGSALFFIAFIGYNKSIFNGKPTPVSAFVLFSFVTFINFLSYLGLSNDWVKTLVAFSDFFTCLIITLTALFRPGPKTKPDRLETAILVIGMLSLGVWFIFRSPLLTNLILQFCYILGFIPIYRNVLRNPKNESAAVWLTWTFAFVLIIIVVFLRWQNNYGDLVNPVLLLFLHAGVGVLGLRKSKTKSKTKVIAEPVP